MTPRSGTTPLGRQLLGAQVVVVAAMAVTVTGVAALLGPPAFESHMQQAGHEQPPLVLQHAQQAFQTAGIIALGAGIATAALGAILVQSVLARRLGTAVRELTDGSQRVAHGDYGTPITLTAGVAELDTVADNLNLMAARIHATEATRRRLLTDISHEMRTPIAAMNVLLEALEDGVADPDPETLAALRRQTARLNRLAGDMKDVSASEQGRLGLDLEETSLDGLVRSAAAAWQPRASARGVRLTAAADLPITAVVDRNRLGQVLDNLLRNALQHTPEGGSIHVGLAVGEGTATVEVRDDGTGISADDLPHVFERFYRGDPQRRRDEGAGTGVGLTISRGIAEAHGGTLDAHSAGPGAGATFRLVLPVT